ncbi:hypothetical protein L6452_05473 [Arctium lappa]|uniref:Uncharacterized protein n=1 Tax=Arctium lappa TaxID=4217 RepID=A0ACB9EG22_ARCLA|nr:hypothetical protein L6452_05473 [Arctium lappa]
MTDESMVMEKKVKLDKKNKPKIVDPIALLASQLAEEALTDEAYDGSTEDVGEALEKAMILLSQHYQKKFQRRTGSNNLRFTSGSKKIEPGASSKPYVPKFEPAKVVKDSAFYWKKLELAEKRENGTILLAKEEYWLDHSDNDAENEETDAMCFIGDDKSDDEEDDTFTDDSKASSSMSNAQSDFLNKVSSSTSIVDDSLTLNDQYYKTKTKRKRRRSKKSRKHDSVLSENSNSSNSSVLDRTVKRSQKLIWRIK